MAEADPSCMTLLKAIDAAHPGTCLLLSEFSACGLAVEGLSAAELRSFFSLGPTHAVDGRDLRVDLRVGLPGESAQSSETPQVQDLSDGQVRLQSGGGAILHLNHSQARDRLIPQALHLALCQQWARCGLIPLHACAFELNGKGVLALGEQGAGKSVLAMSALAAGGQLISDDWVLLGTNSENQLCVERLREFVMLRPGKVLDQLQVRLPELGTRPAGPDGRLSWPIPASDPRFPVSCRLDQLWWLGSATNPRSTISSAASIDQARLFGQLIESAMPLLFSPRFPVERQALSTTLQRLLSGVVIRRVETGIDLIDQPAQTLETLIKP
jgi:hypothetical protein